MFGLLILGTPLYLGSAVSSLSHQLDINISELLHTLAQDVVITITVLSGTCPDIGIFYARFEGNVEFDRSINHVLLPNRQTRKRLLSINMIFVLFISC